MDDHGEILNLLADYADAIDRKDWTKLESAIFADAIDLDFVTWKATTPAEAVAHIRTAIDRCASTQHLLGTSRIDVDGDIARAHTYVRAFHVGRGALQVRILLEEDLSRFPLHEDCRGEIARDLGLPPTCE